MAATGHPGHAGACGFHSFSADCCAIAGQATDMTSVKTNMTRLRGWSQRGTRLEADTPFGSWGTQTFIAGLTHGALIAPWVISKGRCLSVNACSHLPVIDGPAFAAYIRRVLVPELAPGTAVVLDNLATHRNAEAAAALREAGC